MTSLETMLADSDQAARRLHIRMVSRETADNHARTTWDEKPPAVQHHLVCFTCEQSVWCLTPDAAGPSYVFDLNHVLAQTAAHIRQCHEDMIPNR